MKKIPLKTRILAFLGSCLVWIIVNVLFMTCRKSIFGEDVYKELIKKHNKKVLSSSWHRSIFYTIYYFRNMNATIMASRSRDGDFISAILKRFGYYAPRGSSGKGKGGKDALDSFIEHVDRGNIGGLATDAPTGPPYISKHGILYAAAKTGAPIIPHIWYAQPNTRINSWDRSIIPKPFSKLIMIFDREPIYIPKDVSYEQIEEYRLQLDQRMLSLTYQADHWFELCDKYTDPRDIPVPDPVPFPHHPPKKKKSKTK